MRARQYTKMAMYLILVVVLMQSVLALGIAPSRTYEDYAPGKVIKGTVNVINNQEKTFKALVEVKGELAQYTTLSETMFIMPFSEKTHKITYQIILPEGLDVPGDHETQIVVREFAENEDVDTSQVASKVAVISQIRVQVPYPGKYVESKLYISEARQGEDVIFTMPLFNFGTEIVQSVFAKVEIFNPYGEKVGETYTTLNNLAPQKEQKVVARWLANVARGYYKAVATITYDGQEIRLEQDFTVDKLYLDVTNINVDSTKFKLGDIARFDIAVYNDWNERLSNVFAEVDVKQESTIFSHIKTASVDIDPLSTSVLNAYWDTAGLAPGVYDFNLGLKYAGRTTEKVFKVQLSPEGVQVLQQFATGWAIDNRPSEGGRSFFDRNAVLITVLVIIVIVNNIALWIYLMRKKKGGVGGIGGAGGSGGV